MKKRPCDANHCGILIEASKGMCPAHWKMVPKPIQDRIYAAARAHKTSAQRLSSVAFLEAWAEAVEYVAKQEGRLTRNAYRNLANMVRSRNLAAAGQQGAKDVDE